MTETINQRKYQYIKPLLPLLAICIIGMIFAPMGWLFWMFAGVDGYRWCRWMGCLEVGVEIDCTKGRNVPYSLYG